MTSFPDVLVWICFQYGYNTEMIQIVYYYVNMDISGMMPIWHYSLSRGYSNWYLITI